MTSALLESVGATPVGHDDPRGCAPCLPLRDKSGAVKAWVVVDADFYAWAVSFRWFLYAGYAARHGGKVDGRYVKRFMHHDVLQVEAGDEVDHINRNKLDNRRVNLRTVTHAENAQNQDAHSDSLYSKHRGVSYNKRRKKWIARARVGGVDHWLGYHSTEEAAADAAARFREHNMPYSEEASK